MDNRKKTVSVVVPIYNEISMVNEIYDRVVNVFKKLENYEYEIVFFDDGSTDGTRDALEQLCSQHDEVKCVFYTRNFGYLKNTFYAMQQAKGDCAIILHADLQNPPEVIPQFLEKWEKGAQVVMGIKNKSHENKLMYFIRTIGYFVMIHLFGIKLTPHATEFELFDKSFIEVLKGIKVDRPFLRGIVSEFSGKKDFIYYTQDARKEGESKFNFKKYYDFAICGIVQYSTDISRKCILLNVIGILAVIIEFFAVFLPNAGGLSVLDLSNSIILRAIIILLFVLFIFMSFVFEFVVFSVKNSSEKPFVIEEKRINY